jgi:hypothetical protein
VIILSVVFTTVESIGYPATWFAWLLQQLNNNELEEIHTTAPVDTLTKCRREISWFKKDSLFFLELSFAICILLLSYDPM